MGDLALVLPRSVQAVYNNLRVFFIGNGTSSRSKIPLVNSIRKQHINDALTFLRANNNSYRDIEINLSILDAHQSTLQLHSIENPRLQDMLASIQDHNNLSFEILDNQLQSRLECDDFILDRADMQTSGLMTVNLSDYGLENIMLKASLNTWFQMSKQGDLYSTIQSSGPKNTFDDLEWLPCMYPLLFPIGLTGPDSPHREVTVSLEDYVKHQLSIKDDRFATHDTFMFCMYNIIQRRNVARSLRFAIRGKELFQITTSDLEEALKQLINETDIRNPQVKKLFNKVES